jgi:2-polyprenyl-6-methoxyphenol hydroxylase-like FAD-dependent oxidoreductase
MPGRDNRVLIAGGGIGGLAAAIALAQQGIEVEVLERSSFSDETGAGIQLGPNATRLLAALGALDAIEPHAFKPEAIVIFDGLSGRRLTSVPLGEGAARRYAAPYLTLHRADLHAALRKVAESLSKVALTAGFEVASMEPQAGEVIARAADGRTAKGTSLIGADGVWSATRARIAPEASLRFSGATAWRALLKRGDLPEPFDAPVVGLWLGPGRHIVHYPVRAGEELNVVAVTAGGLGRRGWNLPARAETLRTTFIRWSKESKSLLNRASGWHYWSLYRLMHLKQWGEGRVALLGDAAHPVLPFLAQGAALAIEDAVTLARCMAEEPADPAPAFRRYEKVRRPRTARVERLSQRYCRIYHLDGPLRLARDFLLQRRSEQRALQRLDWLYGRHDE